MKNKTILKILLIAVVTFFSCSQQKTKKGTSDFYIAKRDFGSVSNRIEKTKLDSIINQLPYWKLGAFKTADLHESLAREILITDFRKKDLNANEFIILGIFKTSDSTLIFHLDHFDSFIYKYNLDKLNEELSKKPTADGYIEEMPPVTGNISGYEGWYTVNLESENIDINYAQ